MTPTKIKIDNIEYVRRDSISVGCVVDGLPYVIVRSRDQGVMSGFLKEHNHDVVVLLNARQLWKWNSKFCLPDLATKGIGKKSENRYSCIMELPTTIIGVCGILPCTEKAAKELQEHPAEVFH